MKRITVSRQLFALCSAVIFLVVLTGIYGCSSSDDKTEEGNSSTDKGAGKTDGGEGEGEGEGGNEGEGEGGDEGEGEDGGAVNPGLCMADSQCPDGQYCAPETQQCTEPNGLCDEDYQCPGQPLAYCDKNRSTATSSGICRQFKLLCESCQQDTDCGINPDLTSNNLNKCLTLKNGNFCGWAHGNMACPPGFTDGANKGYEAGQCVPQAEECSNKRCQTNDECGFGEKCIGVYQGIDDTGAPALASICVQACTENSDCTPEEICNFVVGLCTPKCDPSENQGMSNCRTGEACHVDGKCSEVCSDDQNCIDRFGKDYGENLICQPPQYRCRISGCEKDSECGTTLGIFCDLNTHECISGCRDNTDCPSMMICVDKGYAGELTYEQDLCSNPPCDCVPPPCTTKGGNIFCSTFQFCCGENRDITCPTGVLEGQCYDAPIPPYCQQCDPNAEDPCPKGNPPGGYDGNCFELQDKDGNKIGNYCAPLCRDDKDCPTQTKCMEVEIQQQGGASTKEKVCSFEKCPMVNPPADGGTADGGATGDAGTP